MQDNATDHPPVRRRSDHIGNIDSAAHFVWEDVVEQVRLPDQGSGPEGLRDILRVMRAAFPDLAFSIQEQIAEGDKIASRFEWTGTQQGTFLGVPATGRSVRVWGIVIDRLEKGRIKKDRIKKGRIKDTRVIMDALGLMMQLRAFAPAGA